MSARQALLQLHHDNPCLSGQKLGDKLGISRERVRQILNEYGIHLSQRRQRPLCRLCYQPLSRDATLDTCPNCRKALQMVLLPCDSCGKLLERRFQEASQSLTSPRYKGHFFHSRLCYGKWFAANYGFKSPHETEAQRECYTIRRPCRRKWDWDAIWQKHLETGYGNIRLSRMLGIHHRTIENILKHKRATTLS